MRKVTGARPHTHQGVAMTARDGGGVGCGCIGFDIVRIRIDNAEPPKGLPSWVPFKGQQNPNWTPQDTSVWPVQRLYWRDLTLRRHRDDLGRREIGFDVKYSIRPVGDWKA